MNANAAAPQYQQVADTLRQRIIRGEYREGDVIPTAAKLEELFSVSNITIRKALSVLSSEGWISGRRGVGTVVVAVPESPRVNMAVTGDFLDWVDSASGKSLPIEQMVLSCGEEIGPAGVCRQLGAEPGTHLWVMHRLRRLENHVISYHVNFGLPSLMSEITPETMAGNRSFADVLLDLGERAPKRMDQRVESSVADRDLAEVLEVGFGTPIFFVENVYVHDDHAATAISHLFLRGDHYAYQTSVELFSDEIRERRR